MKEPIFEFPSFRYEIDDWNFKKKGLLNRINKSEFLRTPLQPFETDRSTNNKSYIRYLEEFLRPELQEFCEEAQVTCSISDAWCVKYKKGDRQEIHNHRSWGYSGVLHVEYDPRVHSPAVFVAPWNDPATDTTLLVRPKDIKEGTLYIAPSFSHHYVPPNISGKPRTVLVFDLLPELPSHQSLNKNV
tara:strand:- start:9 stop:569 length:561 start_codon:yes stop_codon:yes gene_type:complete